VSLRSSSGFVGRRRPGSLFLFSPSSPTPVLPPSPRMAARRLLDEASGASSKGRLRAPPRVSPSSSLPSSPPSSLLWWRRNWGENPHGRRDTGRPMQRDFIWRCPRVCERPQAVEIPRRPSPRPRGAHPAGRSGVVLHGAGRYRAGVVVTGKKKSREGDED
jgi:hypothetical protein